MSDAKKAIELEPRYIKGYYRKATCYLALGKYKLALKDYEYVSLKRVSEETDVIELIFLFDIKIGSEDSTK